MRLWSLDPKYLDTKGLVALWREGLLAQKVLEGKTKGYKFHPQLTRFKEQTNPVKYIGTYLRFVCVEAQRRGYNFDASKIKTYHFKLTTLKVSQGQLDFEFKHLMCKLKKRDPKKLREISKTKSIKTHPLFKKRRGAIETWEVI